MLAPNAQRSILVPGSRILAAAAATAENSKLAVASMQAGG
jgi:hypothetical protein